MKTTVSKERKRKTKLRHKLAGKDSHKHNRHQRPVIALLTAGLTWLIVFGAFRIPGAQAAHAFPAASPHLRFGFDAVLGATAFLVATILLYTLKPKLIQRNSSVILLALICLFSALGSTFILNSAALLPAPWGSLMPFLLPTIFAPLLASLLLGAKAGIAIGMLANTIIAIYAGRSLPIMLNGLVAATLVAHLAPHIRTRSKAVRISLYAGFAQVPIYTLLALQLQNGTFRFEVFAAQIGAGIAAAVLAALLALLVLPMLEHIFNISTNISLLEFSDLGHPLLQRLALEAPGTYHHSLVVANIAQAAADAIGANSLEARISAYFHDIGKLTKPELFAENMFNGPNPHDQLSPSMSTLVITSHVKEGISMAQLHKLPVCVHRAIQEHHGTSILHCFHHKAITSQQEFELNDMPARPLDESQFRYPGPKPSTRISAIICLADAVEAASRCIAKPSPANLEDLVADIVSKRLDDGQLDQCELSLFELSKVKRTFVLTLSNMLHGRIAYPQSHENRNYKPSENESSEQEHAPETSRKPDAARPTA